MAKVIAITSGKGGVGKTTFCVNFGYALSQKGYKVLMIDGDFGLNNLDVVMGIENKIVWDFIDIIENKCRTKQALISDFNNDKLWVLPSNHTYSTFEVKDWHIKKILEDVGDSFDFILIDCPAGIDFSLSKILLNVDSSIVVTTPHISAIRDADKMVSVLKSFFVDEIGVVVNRARGDMILNGEMITIEAIQEHLNVDVVGVVPESDNVSLQLMVGGAIKYTSDIELSYHLIVDYLLNGGKEIFDCTKKYKGFIGNIRKSLRRMI